MRRSREPSTPPTPLWRQAVAQWPDEWQFEWNERAAIKEYLDNKTREDSEREAFEEVSLRYRRRDGGRGR